MKEEYEVRLIDSSVAKPLVVENHYSHKLSTCRYAFGLYDWSVMGFVGVLVYGTPLGRLSAQSISDIVKPENVLELTRLWVADTEKRNTESWFISQTFKWLKKNAPEVKVLMSYSDPMFDHVGFIYQATNWLYQGNSIKRGKSYIHFINGKWIHEKTVVDIYKTTKYDVLIKIDPKYEKKELLKKHRYIYILTGKKEKKRIIKNLKHPILEYPKNNLNVHY